MNQITLDGSKLKAISHASHTAEVTITALALRERLRNFSDITRTRNKLVRDGEKIVDTDYMAFWKGLQDAGVGTLVYGRKGKADRFEWHYSMKKVAKAALEGSNEVAEKVILQKKKPQQTKGSVSAKVSQLKGKRVNHKMASSAKSIAVASLVQSSPSRKERFVYIPLRKDFNLEISVPADLSKDEAEVIGNALRRLSA